MLHRRNFLVGLASALAAPAIVHAGNLMPVKRVVQALTEDEIHEMWCKIMNTTIKNWQNTIAEGIYKNDDLFVGIKIHTFGIQPVWAKDFCK